MNRRFTLGQATGDILYVVVPSQQLVQEGFLWGQIAPGRGAGPACLRKGREHALVDPGPRREAIPAAGWEIVPTPVCLLPKAFTIGVEAMAVPAASKPSWMPEAVGKEGDCFVVYSGPRTGHLERISGPWG